MQHICAVALHDGQMYSIAGGSGGIVYIYKYKNHFMK